jgi:prephenate dehydrogenase
MKMQQCNDVTMQRCNGLTSRISIFHLPSSILYPLPVHFRKITIIGVGLLGGSLGLAVKQRRLAKEVAGFVRRAASVVECEKIGAVDFATCDLRRAVAGADLVVLCTPLRQMRPLFNQMLPALKPGAILTDVGSVKASVIKELESPAARANVCFIGSHPMAGAEKNGVSAARAVLFANAVCVVTPTKKSNRAALRKVEQFWKALGGRLLRLAPEEHDVLVSRSSHLPHLTAATLANFVLNPASPKSQPALCANGFRDTTRIASGSPEMWRDIALTNRRNLSRALGAFIGDLRQLQRVLRSADEKAISKFFEQAKQRRDAWCARCASPSPE